MRQRIVEGTKKMEENMKKCPHLININSKVEDFIADIKKAIVHDNELDIEFDDEDVDAAVSSGKRVLAEFDKLTWFVTFTFALFVISLFSTISIYIINSDS